MAYQDHTEDTTSVPSSAGIPNGHPTTKSNINASVEAIQGAKKPWESVVEDPVDRYWEAQDGKIKRSRDSKMCRHGDKSMCDHCMPLEVRVSFLLSQSYQSFHVQAVAALRSDLR